MTKLRVHHPVGRSVPRRDGAAKVDGSARYPQDLALPPGCLHAATVRAPVACAVLNAIDASAALARRGVTRVLTAADVRGTNRFGLARPDQPVLVEQRICGASDVVALVIARSERDAREGARLVKLALTPSLGVFDPARALDANAPLVHPDHATTGSHANLLAERLIRRGDAPRALAGAHVVVEGEYHTGWVEHAFLAPEAGLALPDDHGRLTLHVATQWPEADMRQAAAALGEPLENLRFVQEAIGGAFGGREDITLQILLVLAARAAGAPVRMVWDRAESIRGHGKRHPFRIRHRIGADRTGRLVAAQVDVLLDAGCYASTSAGLLDNALVHACGPYAIRHATLSGQAVLTNNPFTCAFRGFGANQVAFAMEQQMNKLAAALQMDPGELRHRNFVRAPGRLAAGSRVAVTAGLPRTLDAVVERARRTRLPSAGGGLVFGRGIASAVKNIGYGFGADDRATATLVLTRAGAVVRVGAAEVGQGSETILAQLAAQALGLPIDRVRVEWQDSATAPEAGSTSASRQTVASGNAVLGACKRAVRALATAGGIASLPDGGLFARHTARLPRTRPLDAGPGRHLAMFGWGSCIVDVAVDRETGQVTVRRVICAIDAGRVINPQLLAGQAEGGVVMGQGYALQERFVVREGMPVSVGFESCGVPTSVEAVPHIETLVIEDPEPGGPYGARGIGEITMIPVVPAITAAIHDACGVWVDELPATPERVLAAIRTPNRLLGRQ